MKTLTLNNRTFLAWKVEEAPKDLQLLIRPGKLNPVLVEWDGQDAKWQIDVPTGIYSEPFLLSQVDEERAKGIVENGKREYLSDYYFHYENKTFVASALESFHSWLRANGVMTENPMGEREPDVMDIDRFPLPICMESREEQKELYLRAERIALVREQWTRYQSQTSPEWILIEQLKTK